MTGIADSLERIETITSSTAQHMLRTERNTDNLVEAVDKRVMPSDEFWYGSLQKNLADLLDSPPQATVRYLIEASRHRFANYMDDCEVSLCKSVESLFHQMLVPKIKALPESSKLTLALPRGKQSPRKRSSKDWDKISMPGWVQILRTATEEEINSPLRSVLP